MSKLAYTTANLSDVQLKEQGNQLFVVRKYDDAVSCYTKAIMKNPNNATYFTNRALCYLKLKRWELSCHDCRRALDLDSNFLKAHFFLGQCLIEMELYDEAIKHLQRAFDLSKEQKQNFGDDITWQLRLARKKRWSLLEEKRICQEIELQTYINRLIKEDMDRNLARLKIDESIHEHELREKQQEFEQQCDDHIKELNNIFAKVDDRRRKRDVPDYLCGKISFEILTDPVITPSGITYERKDIEEHLQRVGHFDPVTRVKLTQDQLIPNFSMKEVVDSFIAENEWALDF
ncbi:E3 ubiquitin-protein ligase CHIP isoform X1 [Bactrocera neohumeralis]|uniref:STIP1 homology and U box-containing protein 1 isoform X1 n=1 Tax=Bactrocera tryoni TaxID=59916 RepID=UPI001A96DAAF|nr:STIP1 homology and U box-containing protein 1 isoform X1 [Bactrocera tryoni]XP_039969901.1 STIP1 homology and U box-containing protein 1 isoform X1 [Bactrocera tryoni]XP_039969902.1 STIP1 homology and U box-containing protein 1 isoform X1 [Bactrocera tryoni]XP_050338484.1 E3 ubiquitin-protein ligase CHIP isoform X1 [Bactrocera neohumeralis]XP_050338486.1 E3 ubiquitin-protein ligase CHIP isoform X1 [Bactrocera neohumeralis]XP_050338487.1 E3 ubiquitin-protein ligase CHIP isoform X1 [Bactrocer